MVSISLSTFEVVAVCLLVCLFVLLNLVSIEGEGIYLERQVAQRNTTR